jgi:2-keto-4-pentenoate hydratase
MTPEIDRAPEGAIRRAVARLQEAASSRRPCSPVRDLIGSTDIAAAYAVQQGVIQHRLGLGAKVVGRKIGLTSPAVQAQVGVDRPDFGVLLDEMWVDQDSLVPSERLLQPKAEVEIAFVLKASLDTDEFGIDQVRAAVEYAVAAVEIVDSRVLDWDITITDTIADNASSGLFVLGHRFVELSEFEPADVVMAMRKDGVPCSSGSGRACLGDPLNALAWLATTARDLGAPLQSGEVILSGALGPMVSVGPGTTIDADISGLGPVMATFS